MKISRWKTPFGRLYFSSLDAAITCLSRRFKNSAFELARNIESVFIEVINTGNVPTTQNISAHYRDDIDDSHLSMLGDLCRSADHRVSLEDICNSFIVKNEQRQSTFPISQ